MCCIGGGHNRVLCVCEGGGGALVPVADDPGTVVVAVAAVNDGVHRAETVAANAQAWLASHDGVESAAESTTSTSSDVFGGVAAPPTYVDPPSDAVTELVQELGQSPGGDMPTIIFGDVAVHAEADATAAMATLSLGRNDVLAGLAHLGAVAPAFRCAAVLAPHVPNVASRAQRCVMGASSGLFSPPVTRNPVAERALAHVHQRMALPSADFAQACIASATDPDHLSTMFEGWTPWV